MSARKVASISGYAIHRDTNGNYHVTPPGGLRWREQAVNLETAKRWIGQHIAERQAARRNIDAVYIRECERSVRT